MKNYMLTLQYDGTRYNGWQKQGNTENTIQGKLETLFERLTGQPVEVHGSGRTDAGVHALGQVASVRLETDMSCREIKAKCGEYLPGDISVLRVEEATQRFHARLSAKAKTYVYTIRTAETNDVFRRNYLWHLPGRLDTDAMRKAAESLIGEHDFRAFCSLKKMKKSSVRKIFSIDIEDGGDELQLRFTGSGFLYHMVRIITGTLVEVGQSKLKAGDVAEILACGDRTKAGPLAPAQGLTLFSVTY